VPEINLAHLRIREQRLGLAFGEHGLDLRLVEERPWERREAFLALNPAATTPVLSERIFAELRAADIPVGVGRYDEARLIYVTPAFASGARSIDERRTIHLGIDLFVEAGSPLYAAAGG
jgi:murein DD-endopeptidase MepM/ murein hydrolase activator NlpD